MSLQVSSWNPNCSFSYFLARGFVLFNISFSPRCQNEHEAPRQKNDLVMLPKKDKSYAHAWKRLPHLHEIKNSKQQGKKFCLPYVPNGRNDTSEVATRSQSATIYWCGSERQQSLVLLQLNNSQLIEFRGTALYHDLFLSGTAEPIEQGIKKDHVDTTLDTKIKC